MTANWNTTIPDGEVTNPKINANAAISRSKLAQRVLADHAILPTDWRVWDALTQPLPGEGCLEAGVTPVSFSWDPNVADSCFFTANRNYRVLAITATVEVVGTDGGAVTATIKKAASGTDIASGTLLHTGSINLKGTVDTNQTLSLSATSSVLDIASGTRIGFDLTGTPTSARGSVTVLLAPAPSADDLRLVTGTYGSDPGPYLSTGDVKATSGTQRAVCFVRIPDDYEGDPETLQIRLYAGMVTTVADTSCTVDLEAWRIDRDGTLGAADVVSTSAQSINSLTAAAYTFTLTTTTLAAGDVLVVRVSIAYVDSATVTAVVGAVWQAEVLADSR